MYRRHLLAAAASLVAVPTLRAQSGPWPSQPIKLMIGFPPGGPTDITMRALSARRW